MYKQALKLIEKYDTIIIHRHSNPDGDAIGSQFGLQQILQLNYPRKNVYIVGDSTKRYAFMDGATAQIVADDVYENALAIILDTSARFMISDNRYTMAKATLRFDHHIKCEDIADVDIIDTNFESCCGLITDFAVKSNLKLNDAAAKSLFCGMVTDSGRFRYDSTTSKTFELAAILKKYNFDTNEIYASLYADELEMLKLRAKYTLKIQLTDKNTAYIITTKQELDSCSADEFTISRGMVGVMSDIKGVDNWVNFTETDKGVLCELRSKKYNINPIATKYGGGGHAKASGATIADLETAMLMLKDLDDLAD